MKSTRVGVMRRDEEIGRRIMREDRDIEKRRSDSRAGAEKWEEKEAAPSECSHEQRQIGRCDLRRQCMRRSRGRRGARGPQHRPGPSEHVVKNRTASGAQRQEAEGSPAHSLRQCVRNPC
eukprot:318093-Rhodomonas_salina.2